MGAALIGGYPLKMVVAHPSLNRGGGAERVCLEFVRALVKRGYRVKLATLDKTDWSMLNSRFGNVAKPDEEFYFMGSSTFNFGMLSQATITASLFPLMLLSLRSDGDLLINTYGDLLDCVADLAYVNAVPVRLSYKFGCSTFSHSFVFKLATRIYDKVLSRHFAFKSLLLANSKFIQTILKREMNRNSIVVYPPVNLDIFKEPVSCKVKRKDLVVSVSRLRFGKRLDIIPRIAKLVADADFVLLALADGASKPALKELMSLIRCLGVEDRVRLLMNQPFDRYLDVLSSASIYLHTQPCEAFGMAVVEAMAAGCVPVVPRLGGPWVDILGCKQGFYGFSYGSVDEAAGIIGRLLRDDALRVGVAERAGKRVLAFDSSVFERKILNAVEKVYNRKFVSRP